jgi:hypothetical protein
MRLQRGAKVGQPAVVRPCRVEDGGCPPRKPFLHDRHARAELAGDHPRPADLARKALAGRRVKPPGVRVAEAENSADRQMLTPQVAIKTPL